MSEQLKPCPFCGDVPQITKHHREDIYSFMHRCKVLGPISWGFIEDRQAHLDKWNTRVQPNTCTKDGGQCGLGGFCDTCLNVEPVLPRCTCPSGDGSLRWPCPVCPPEPVAWMYKRHSAKERNGDMVQYIGLSSSDLTEVREGRHCEGHMVLSSCEDHYDWQPLYRHLPAQAPVVLPERAPVPGFGVWLSLHPRHEVWNWCLDEFKRLNPGITEAAPLRKS